MDYSPLQVPSLFLCVPSQLVLLDSDISANIIKCRDGLKRTVLFLFDNMSMSYLSQPFKCMMQNQLLIILTFQIGLLLSEVH